MRSTISWQFVFGVAGTFGLALMIVGIVLANGNPIFDTEVFIAGLAILGFATLVTFGLAILIFVQLSKPLDQHHWKELKTGEALAVASATLGVLGLGAIFITAMVAFAGRLKLPLTTKETAV